MANQMTPNYGAKIWNEYIFLLKCNMATIWTQNLYFSAASYLDHIVPLNYPLCKQSNDNIFKAAINFGPHL